MDPVEVLCETSLLQNRKRFLECTQVKILFRFRRDPFFFTVYMTIYDYKNTTNNQGAGLERCLPLIYSIVGHWKLMRNTSFDAKLNGLQYESIDLFQVEKYNESVFNVSF